MLPGNLVVSLADPWGWYPCTVDKARQVHHRNPLAAIYTGGLKFLKVDHFSMEGSPGERERGGGRSRTSGNTSAPCN